MGASSCKIISGCVNDILWMHLELKRRSIACLSPCWPQLRRIVTCGQLLVLCHDRGELSQAEFLSILEILQDLLAAHHDSWPVAEELSKHFAGIATMNGESESRCSDHADARARCTAKKYHANAYGEPLCGVGRCPWLDHIIQRTPAVARERRPNVMKYELSFCAFLSSAVSRQALFDSSP